MGGLAGDDFKNCCTAKPKTKAELLIMGALITFSTSSMVPIL